MPTDSKPKGIATCHPQRKMQARGLCKPCYDKWLKVNNPGYKARQAGINAEWRRQNPDKCKEHQRARKERELVDPALRERTKAIKRTYHLKRHYGITPVELEGMFNGQGGRCAICNRSPTKLGLHVDHCHSNGVVRGLLCHQCNWYIGTLENDPNNLVRLIAYLRNSNSLAVSLLHE